MRNQNYKGPLKPGESKRLDQAFEWSDEEVEQLIDLAQADTENWSVYIGDEVNNRKLTNDQYIYVLAYGLFPDVDTIDRIELFGKFRQTVRKRHNLHWVS